MTNDAAPPTHLWFLNTWVTIRIPATAGTDSLSVIEHHGPFGDSPPLHVHRTEDELFQVLEGEVRFQIGETERRAVAGDLLLIPKGTPHTYRVESSAGGHWFTVTVHGDFERFVRKLSRPAERLELPTPTEPTPEAIQSLVATASEFGIEVVGPPLH